MIDTLVLLVTAQLISIGLIKFSKIASQWVGDIVRSIKNKHRQWERQREIDRLVENAEPENLDDLDFEEQLDEFEERIEELSIPQTDYVSEFDENVVGRDIL